MKGPRLMCLCLVYIRNPAEHEPESKLISSKISQNICTLSVRHVLLLGSHTFSLVQIDTTVELSFVIIAILALSLRIYLLNYVLCVCLSVVISKCVGGPEEGIR